LNQSQKELWIVTGGAGYIGSNVAISLHQAGFEVVIVDDFSLGERETLWWLPATSVIDCDLRNHSQIIEELRARFPSEFFKGIAHCAGLKKPSESMVKPLEYFSINVEGTRSMLEIANNLSIPRILFSSSCSVFGSTLTPAREIDPLSPMSPYASSKMLAELMISSYASSKRGVESLALRYFNVIGVGCSGALDLSSSNLLPALARSALGDGKFLMHKASGSTEDGTCVRDYIDVADVARAHLLVAERWQENVKLPEVLNLGTKRGYSVKEIVDVFQDVSGLRLDIQMTEPRQGDPDSVLANSQRAKSVLNWVPEIPLTESVRRAWSHYIKYGGELRWK